MDSSPDLIPICDGGRWGYVDRKANVAIRPSFTYARPFRDGLALVNVGGQVGRSEADIVGGKWGFLDAAGAYAFSERFDDASDFSEGLAAVNLGARVKYAAHDDFYYSDGGKWGFVGKSGAMAVPARYGFAKSYSAGMAPVSEAGRYGYLGTDGAWKIAPAYSAASPFREGLAAVRVGNRYAYIDEAGNYRIEPRFELAYDFHNGLAGAHIGDPYEWHFYDTQGSRRFTAPEGTAHVGHFREGRVMANLCKLERYSDGRIYPGGLRRSLGYLDGKGAWAIRPQYAWGGDFHDGLAWVKHDEGGYSYIRPSGSRLHTPELEAASSFEGGLAAVRVKGCFALITVEGDVFWSER